MGEEDVRSNTGKIKSVKGRTHSADDHPALGKKAPGKVITWGMPSNQFLSHTTTKGQEHHNYVSYKPLAVFHLSTEHIMYQYPGQELRILSYPEAQRCDLLESSSAHSLVVTHSLCKILIGLSLNYLW